MGAPSAPRAAGTSNVSRQLAAGPLQSEDVAHAAPALPTKVRATSASGSELAPASSPASLPASSEARISESLQAAARSNKLKIRRSNIVLDSLLLARDPCPPIAA